MPSCLKGTKLTASLPTLVNLGDNYTILIKQLQYSNSSVEICHCRLTKGLCWAWKVHTLG